MKLTEREAQIVERLAEGDSPKDIAESLGISRKTVYTHVYHIAERLPPGRGAPLRRVLRHALERSRAA